MPGNIGVRRLALTDRGHERRVELHFTIHGEVGREAAHDVGRLEYLVHHWVLGTSFGGERQHRDPRLVTGELGVGGGRRDRDRRELFGVGVGKDAGVTEGNRSAVVEDHQHRAADHRYVGRYADQVNACSQNIGSGAARSRNTRISLTDAHHQCGDMKRVV